MYCQGTSLVLLSENHKINALCFPSFHNGCNPACKVWCSSGWENNKPSEVSNDILNYHAHLKKANERKSCSVCTRELSKSIMSKSKSKKLLLKLNKRGNFNSCKRAKDKRNCQSKIIIAIIINLFHFPL